MADQNPYLEGNFAPWRLEGEAHDLEVIGEIPRDLRGAYYRNGPNPAYEPTGKYHWFDGDGMIHAVSLRDGRAAYRNRYVLSDGLKEEQTEGKALYPGLLALSPSEVPRFKITGNTNIVAHAGRLLALVEAGLPTEMTPQTLATVGLYDFGGRLGGPMTAHPKLDPETGEMLFFGYSPFPPYLQYHVVDRAGVLVRSEVIDIPWPSMIHDFAITANEVIFILCPIVFSFEDVKRRGGAFSWEPERGTRIGVMPRTGGSADVRWFETEACYVFHPMNAYRDDDLLTLDVCRYPELYFMQADRPRERQFSSDDGARLHRWRLDLGTGSITSTPLDDRNCEFPRIDERLTGRAYRYGYVAAKGAEADGTTMPVFSTLQKHDLERGTCEVRRYPLGNGVGEPLFVPREGSRAEDDGYVVSLVYDQTRNASEFVILDAQALTAEPLARVLIPHRVPYGFHGNWVPTTN